MKIGGNITGTFQKYTTYRDEIGCVNREWKDAFSTKGYLDLAGGDSKYDHYDAKIQESTHIFICDYADLESMNITSEGSRMKINGKIYDIMVIDNPMELNEHLEIYLKYTGGQ